MNHTTAPVEISFEHLGIHDDFGDRRMRRPPQPHRQIRDEREQTVRAARAGCVVRSGQLMCVDATAIGRPRRAMAAAVRLESRVSASALAATAG